MVLSQMGAHNRRNYVCTCCGDSLFCLEKGRPSSIKREIDVYVGTASTCFGDCCSRFCLSHPTLIVESVLVCPLEQQRTRDARAAAPSGEMQGRIALLVLSAGACPSEEQGTHEVLVPTPTTCTAISRDQGGLTTS